VELLTRKGFTMKRVSVVILVAVLGLVGWALPAGAEKVRLTEDQMDNVSAGLTMSPGFTVPGFPVDKSFDFTATRDFPSLFGVTGDAMANTFVQAPCKSAPSLLCMGSEAGVGTMLGPFGAYVMGGGNLYLGNATGNHIFQGNGGAIFTVIH
jgi:hypothetical protein